VKRFVILFAVFTFAVSIAYAQTRQINGPLIVAVGETITFSSDNPFGSTWSFSPSASFQIIGHSNGDSVVVRVVSMSRDGRATVRLSGTSFHVDVVESVAHLPAPAPGVAPTLTHDAALQFANDLSPDDLVVVMSSIGVLAATSGPITNANINVMIEALREAFGDISVLAAQVLITQMGDTGAMLLLLENADLTRRINDLAVVR